MPPSPEQIKDIKAMIAVARRSPVNMGFCLGRTPEEAQVLLSRTRNPAALGRAARAEGETARVATGTLSVEGRAARFTCDKRPPTGLQKQMKGFFRSIGLPLQVTLLDEAGQEI